VNINRVKTKTITVALLQEIQSKSQSVKTLWISTQSMVKKICGTSNF